MSTWVEIFAGGRQVDSLGRPHDGDDLIDKALATFDPENHKPPVVLGHPTSDAEPAHGWVEALKAAYRDGRKFLLAKIGQVSDELVNLTRSGRYQTRSASFYPDGSLRHVGFLGAQPPAVKGLAPVQFAEFSYGDDAEDLDSKPVEDVELTPLERVRQLLESGLITQAQADFLTRFVGNFAEFAGEVLDSMTGQAQGHQDPDDILVQAIVSRTRPRGQAPNINRPSLSMGPAFSSCASERRLVAGLLLNTFWRC